MTYPLVVIGAGGFGRETLDVFEAIDATMGDSPKLVGVIDDCPSDVDRLRLHERALPYLGTIEEWLRKDDDGARFVVAVGNPHVRRQLVGRIAAHRSPAAPLVHPDATIGTMTSLYPGTVVCAGARVSTNVQIGTHTHINAGAIIGHDTTLGDFVSINPGAIISGAVEVADGVLVGAGATVLQGLAIGSDATIGAAACVVRDVEPIVTVKGVPAR